mgnify:CR=1 FL=1
MKASFFRNMPNYSTLYEHTSRYKGVVAEYHLIASIYLAKNEFTAFCDNFKNSYDYLLPYVDEAIIEHGVWKCVSVIGREREVLVVMDHYQYPRYLAISKN